MAIQFDDVKYYKSELIDFDDDTKNGMGVGDIIHNDRMNEIFNEVTATEREEGVIKRAKIFINNGSNGRTMKRTLFHVKQNVYTPDMLRLYEAKENPTVNFTFIDEQDGSSTAISAGTELSINISEPSGAVAGDIIDRKLTVLGEKYTVDSAPSDTSIKLKEDVTIDIKTTDILVSSDDFDYLESDEDFTSLKPLVNAVIKASVHSGDNKVYISADDSNYFSAGDDIVIPNEYYQTVFRGKIDSIDDDNDDDSLKIITLDKDYIGNILPALRTSICNGVIFDLPDGKTKSAWAELEVQATSNVQSEVISQFQIGLHFDDVASV